MWCRVTRSTTTTRCSAPLCRSRPTRRAGGPSWSSTIAAPSVASSVCRSAASTTMAVHLVSAQRRAMGGPRALVDERKPKSIGINTSGLFSTPTACRPREGDCSRRLGPITRAPRSAELLAVGWLESKMPEETDGVSPGDADRPRGHRRGLLDGGDHAGDDDHRGRGVVDAAAGGGTGARSVVPAVNLDLARGRHGGPRRRRPRHSTWRPPPLRLRHRLSGFLHRHTAERLRAQGRRNRRAGRAANGAAGGTRLQDSRCSARSPV